jgi:hypothetical protein
MFPVKDVSAGAMVFGEYGTKFNELVPDKKDIPKEFNDWHNPWCELQSTWFFSGLKGYSFIPKDGVDLNMAMNHLGAIQSSWEPQHEDKVLYVGFLMSEWFEDVVKPDGHSAITGKKVNLAKKAKEYTKRQAGNA